MMARGKSWAQNALEALKDVEGFKHLRLELMQRALKKSDSSTMYFDTIPVVYDEAGAAPLFEAAWAGDGDANAALCLLASQMITSGQQLPPPLLFHVYATLLEIGLQKPRRGRGSHDRYEFVTRNLIIIAEIEGVCKETGLRATRSPATDAECACSIVAERHGWTERKVEEIWGKRRRV